MDRQHWINLAYKLCFWEEEQVHGSQINQINKIRPSLYPHKITSAPHGFYTNSEEEKIPQTGKTKQKQHIYLFGSMFRVTEMKFKL